MYKLLNNYKKLLLIGVFLAAFLVRMPLMLQMGKDYETYVTAVNMLINGANPYTETLRSYADKDVSSGGYAYFPGILYTFYFLYVLSFIAHVPAEVLWKLPNLLAEFGVGFLLYKMLSPKGFGITLFGLVAWLFHPYLLIDQKYTYTDAIPVFFMLLSLYLVTKDSVLSGVSFALGVVFKTFPVFVLPVYMILTKSKMKFLAAGLLVGLAVSLPFMRSLQDFITYMRGSVFVHESRGITGRPFLFYISYFYKIEFFQIIPIKVYTFLSAFSGWLVIVLAYFLLKVKNQYILATLGFICFYLFTPVLNRTYLLWFLPVLIVALAELKQKKFFYIVLSLFYIFYSWYLWQWIDGFHITRPW